MSAIYRRARPTQWSDVVGQQHVKSVLQEALRQGKIGHAYIFSGPRGVGKTTIARLIAMAASCTSEEMDKPCGKCQNCQLVTSGHHPDVEEIDAASNNGVDSIRQLCERAQLSSLRGGHRVYILDEAHMLTGAAANAFLKTLEEPPAGVVFVLATTEPEKLLPTIVSRCQHYRFRRLSAEEIAGKLKLLVVKEGAEATDDALALIGRLADGAMRDGESLLERMLAGSSSFNLQDVESALGLPPIERTLDIAKALMEGDSIALLQGAQSMYAAGFAAATILKGVSESFSKLVNESVAVGDNAKALELLRAQNALDGQRLDASADLLALELALGHALMSLQTPTLAAANHAPTPMPAPANNENAMLLRQLQNEIEILKREMRQLAIHPVAAPVAMARGGALSMAERRKLIDAIPKDKRKTMNNVDFDLFLENGILRIAFHHEGPFNINKRTPVAEWILQGAQKAFQVSEIVISHEQESVSWHANSPQPAFMSHSAQVQNHSHSPSQPQPQAQAQRQPAEKTKLQPLGASITSDFFADVVPESKIKTAPVSSSDHFDRPPDSIYNAMAIDDGSYERKNWDSANEEFLYGEPNLSEPPPPEEEHFSEAMAEQVVQPIQPIQSVLPARPVQQRQTSSSTVQVGSPLEKLLRNAKLENRFMRPSALEETNEENEATEEAEPEND